MNLNLHGPQDAFKCPDIQHIRSCSISPHTGLRNQMGWILYKIFKNYDDLIHNLLTKIWNSVDIFRHSFTKKHLITLCKIQRSNFLWDSAFWIQISVSVSMDAGVNFSRCNDENSECRHYGYWTPFWGMGRRIIILWFFDLSTFILHSDSVKSFY